MSKNYLGLLINRKFWKEEMSIYSIDESLSGINDLDKVGNKFHKIESIWSDSSKCEKARFEIEIIYEKYLSQLSLIFEAHHKCGFDDRCWRVVLGPWLFQVISVIYDRYYTIENASLVVPNLWCHVLDDEYVEIPNDLYDLHFLLADDYFNYWIYSRVLNYKFKNLPKVSVKREDIVKKPKIGYLVYWLKLILRNTNILLLKVFSSRTRTIGHSTYIPIAKEYLLSISTLFKYFFIFPQNRVYPIKSVDFENRRKIFRIDNKNNSFDSFLGGILPFLLPKSLLENFAYINSRSIILPQNCKYLVSAESWHYDEYFKFTAANHLLKGGMLVGIQHGGTYGGVHDYVPHENHELIITDNYLTWGWIRSDMEKVKSFFAIKLTGKKEIEDFQKNTKILFIGTGFPRYLINFQLLPSKLNSYFLSQISFISSLDERILSFTVFRLFQNDYGWNFSKRLKEKFPLIQFDDGQVPFLKSIKSYRICIIDHCSTTWLETLSLNMPTIVYGVDVISNYSSKLQPYFDLLTESNIVHYSPESAARFLIEVYEDVDKWWLSEATQTARLLVCNELSRTTNKPLYDYGKKLIFEQNEENNE